ncbi:MULTISPECIES: DUF4124 domain-containing protein [Luteimonas]|uniref:DUF4124 domain-containing protein n=1 Tax=Luteimonas TaxID=83614 RepID=UPI000C7A13F4|nr:MULTISPECIES: DUF4124 domain-containing protein [Luteimonas]
MDATRVAIGLVLAGLAAGFAQDAAAQVYKCKAADGSTVYAQQPCGANATEVQVRAGPTAAPAGSESSNYAAIARSTALSGAAIRERNCVARQEADIYRPFQARKASQEQQIAGLNANLARANNNLAGATWSTGLRNQISALRESISRDQLAADSQMASARQQCAAERQRAEEEIRRQAEQPAE